MDTQQNSAIILAGGKSSRMGRAKALLEFDGEPLIVHLVRGLNQLFGETVVVAAPEQELPALAATVARDEVAYQGPVGGIYYGLKAAHGEACFVTSCDVAFLNRPLITHLFTQILDNEVVVPYWEERFQPLHAVYRRSVLPLLAGQLERGELRPIYLFDNVRTLKVSADEIRSFRSRRTKFSQHEYAVGLSCSIDALGAIEKLPAGEWRDRLHRRAFWRGAAPSENQNCPALPSCRGDSRSGLLHAVGKAAGFGRTGHHWRRRRVGQRLCVQRKRSSFHPDPDGQGQSRR